MSEEKKEEKTLTKKEIEEKIKVHGKTLEELASRGRNIQQKRQELGEQLNLINVQSNELVGAIKALQDLKGYVD